MANNINVNVGAAGLAGSIQQQVNQAQAGLNRRPLQLKLDPKGFRQPLGQITGDINEFQKSLDASVARTFAFGAAVGVVNQVNQAFKALVTTTIEVQKELANINVLLGVTAADLSKFSSQLFGVAKNTAQTFQTVAEAATEFSRQGLSAAQTLKRVEDAMVLTRLSGLSATQSVEALTAAVNGFRKEAITSTEVINRLANVDAAFAVSSKDLADALSRAGSTAQGAKVEFNELLAAVTSVQQQTARGGAVIGNAFKSIFTRIQRSGVQDALNEIGVATKNTDGSFRSGIQVIKDYAATYNTLTDAQKAYTSEQIAGVFQINNLKALVSDLNSEYSIYNRALATANNSTDQAARRNDALNKTMAAMLAQTAISAQQLAAAIGELGAQPAIERVLKIVVSIADFLTKALDPEKGSRLAKGLFSGIGAFIAGPGLVIVGGAFLKLFAFISKQAGGALKAVFNINTETARQQQLQQGILALVTSEESVYRQLVANAGNQAAQEQIILDALKKQTAERARQQQFLSEMAASPAFAGVEVRDGTVQRRRGRRGRGAPIAGGHVPVFANTDEVMVRDFAGSAEADAVRRGVGGARPTARVVKTSIDPKRDAIFNRDMVASMGMPSGAQRIAAGGFIPNFISDEAIGFDISKEDKAHGKAIKSRAFGVARTQRNKGGGFTGAEEVVIDLSKGAVITPNINEFRTAAPAKRTFTDNRKQSGKYAGAKYRFSGNIPVTGPVGDKSAAGQNLLSTVMDARKSMLSQYLKAVTQDFFKQAAPGSTPPFVFSDNMPDVNAVNAKFQKKGIKGDIFEEIIETIQGDVEKQTTATNANAPFDLNPTSNIGSPLKKLFELAPGVTKGELKAGTVEPKDVAEKKFVDDVIAGADRNGVGSVDPIASQMLSRVNSKRLAGNKTKISGATTTFQKQGGKANAGSMFKGEDGEIYGVNKQGKIAKYNPNTGTFSIDTTAPKTGTPISNKALERLQSRKNSPLGKGVLKFRKNALSAASGFIPNFNPASTGILDIPGARRSPKSTGIPILDGLSKRLPKSTGIPILDGLSKRSTGILDIPGARGSQKSTGIPILDGLSKRSTGILDIPGARGSQKSTGIPILDGLLKKSTGILDIPGARGSQKSTGIPILDGLLKKSTGILDIPGARGSQKSTGIPILDGFKKGLSRAINTEKKLGGNPVVDFDSRVGTFVRDKNTQANLSQAVAQHGGLAQALTDSRKAQGLAAGHIPNFAPTLDLGGDRQRQLREVRQGAPQASAPAETSTAASETDTKSKSKVDRGSKVAGRAGISFLIQGILTTAISAIPPDKLSPEVTSAMSGAISGMSVGALAGPWGILIGGVLGAAMPFITKAFDPLSKVKESAEKFGKALEKLNAEQKQTTENFDNFVQTQQKLREAARSGDSKAVEKQVQELNKIINSTTTESVPALLAALGKSPEEIENLRSKITQPSSEKSQAQLGALFSGAALDSKKDPTKSAEQLQSASNILINALEDAGKLNLEEELQEGYAFRGDDFIKRAAAELNIDDKALLDAIGPDLDVAQAIKEGLETRQLSKKISGLVVPLERARGNLERELGKLGTTLDNKFKILSAKFQAGAAAFESINFDTIDLFQEAGLISKKEAIEKKAGVSDEQIRATAEFERQQVTAQNATVISAEERKKLEEKLVEINDTEREQLIELKANTAAQLAMLRIQDQISANTKLSSDVLSKSDLKLFGQIGGPGKTPGSRAQAETAQSLLEFSKTLESLFVGLDLGGVKDTSADTIAKFNISQLANQAGLNVDSSGSLDEIVQSIKNQLEAGTNTNNEAVQHALEQMVKAFEEQREAAQGDPEEVARRGMQDVGAALGLDQKSFDGGIDSLLKGLTRPEQANILQAQELNKNFKQLNTQLLSGLQTENDIQEKFNTTAEGIKGILQDVEKAQNAMATNEKNMVELLREMHGGGSAAAGFIPSFSPLSRAVTTERNMGGSPVVDYHPSVGNYVRDGRTQKNFADVIASHPEGIPQAVNNSKILQNAAGGFVPNFINLIAQVKDELGVRGAAGISRVGQTVRHIMKGMEGPLNAVKFELEAEQAKYDADKAASPKPEAGAPVREEKIERIKNPKKLLREELANSSEKIRKRFYLQQATADKSKTEWKNIEFFGTPLSNFKKELAQAKDAEGRDKLIKSFEDPAYLRNLKFTNGDLNELGMPVKDTNWPTFFKKIMGDNFNLGAPPIEETLRNANISAFTKKSLSGASSFVNASNEEYVRAIDDFRANGTEALGRVNQSLVSPNLVKKVALKLGAGTRIRDKVAATVERQKGPEGQYASLNDVGKVKFFLNNLDNNNVLKSLGLGEGFSKEGQQGPENTDLWRSYRIAEMLKSGKFGAFYQKATEKQRSDFILPTLRYLKDNNYQLPIPKTDRLSGEFAPKSKIAAALGVPPEVLGDLLEQPANARGFVPNFSALGEIAASVGAGYKNPVTPSQVRSTNIPGLGKVNYNTQEKVVRAPGMQQPFIVPPRNSRAAPDYARKVEGKFGFNPYKSDVAAGGFVPNFQGLPNMDFTKFSESVTEFGEDVDRFAEAMTKTLEGQLNVNVDTSTTVDSAAIRDAVQNGVINAITNYFTSGPGVQNIVDLSQQVFNQNLG